MPITIPPKVRRPRRSAAERSAWAADMVALFEAFRDSLDSDEQQKWAERFDNYSPTNALRIAMQDPNASLVHGYDDWKRLGRHVREGETSHIWIRCPAGRYPVRSDSDDETNTRHQFRWAAVYDFRQTDPNEDPNEEATT